jgi:hypothetical protein
MVPWRVTWSERIAGPERFSFTRRFNFYLEFYLGGFRNKGADGAQS